MLIIFTEKLFSYYDVMWSIFRDDSLKIDAIVSATQEKSWKIYKSHILMAIPSMPRVLGIRKYKQTSENADGYVLQWFLTLHWGKIISSDHNQNIVWQKNASRFVSKSKYSMILNLTDQNKLGSRQHPAYNLFYTAILRNF